MAVICGCDLLPLLFSDCIPVCVFPCDALVRSVSLACSLSLRLGAWMPEAAQCSNFSDGKNSTCWAPTTLTTSTTGCVETYVHPNLRTRCNGLPCLSWPHCGRRSSIPDMSLPLSANRHRRATAWDLKTTGTLAKARTARLRTSCPPRSARQLSGSKTTSYFGRSFF